MSLNKFKPIKKISLIAVVSFVIWIPWEITNLIPLNETLSIAISTICGEYLYGVPFFLLYHIHKALSMEFLPISSWQLLFYIFFCVSVIQIVFSFITKLKWKYAAGLFIIVLCVLANVWASKVYLREMLTPHWQTYQYDQFHFSIESPYPLTGEADNAPKMNNEHQVYVLRELHLMTTPVALTSPMIDCCEYEKKHIRSLAWHQNYWGKKIGKENVAQITCSGVPAIRFEHNKSTWITVVRGQFQWTFIISNTNYYAEYYPVDIAGMVDRVIQSIKIQI